MAKKEIPMMVVETRVKEVAKRCAEGTRCSGDFAKALNEKVGDLINAAVTRCRANGRNTLKASDL